MGISIIEKNTNLLPNGFLHHGFHLFEGVLNPLDAEEGDEVRHSIDDEGATEQRRERGARGFGILEGEKAQHRASDAKEHDAPPTLEAHLLVVERGNEEADAFKNDPEGEEERQRGGHKNAVGQEEHAEHDVDDTHQHTRAIVGQEVLRP